MRPPVSIWKVFAGRMALSARIANAKTKQVFEHRGQPCQESPCGLRWCANCEKQFTVTIGTIFEDSHIPLRKWLIAWYLICSSKKGIQFVAIATALGIGQLSQRAFHGAPDSLCPERPCVLYKAVRNR